MNRKPTLTMILAVANDGTIGIDGKLPWSLPEDMKRFKARTMHRAFIMGRKTYESLGRALPHRQLVVVTRSTCMLYNDIGTIFTSNPLAAVRIANRASPYGEACEPTSRSTSDEPRLRYSSRPDGRDPLQQFGARSELPLVQGDGQGAARRHADSDQLADAAADLARHVDDDELRMYEASEDDAVTS